MEFQRYAPLPGGGGPAHPRGGHGAPTTISAAPVRRTMIEGTPVVQLIKEAGVNERKCTDVRMLGVFLTFLICMGYLALSVLVTGNGTVRLTHSVNFNGKVCGASPSVRHQPYLYYPLDASVKDAHGGVKVLPGARRCLKTCPSPEDVRQHKVIPITRTQIDRAPLGITSTLVEYSIYTPVYASVPVAGRLCFPEDNNLAYQLSQHVLIRPLLSFRAVLGGLITAYPVLLMASVTALGLSTAYMWLFKACPKLALLVSAFVAVLVGFSLGFGLLMKVSDVPVSGTPGFLFRLPAETALTCLTGLTLIVGSIALVVLLFVTRELLSVIARVFETCAEVAWTRGGGMLASPILVSLVTMVLGWFWIVIFLHISGSSTGSQVATPLSPERNGSVTVLSGEREDTLPGWAVLFLLLWMIAGVWGLEFINCLLKFSVCYTGTMWYFCGPVRAPNEEDAFHPPLNHAQQLTPSLVSLSIGLTNHAGSFAKAAWAFLFTRPCRVLMAWMSPRYFSDQRPAQSWVTSNGFVEMSIASTSFSTSMRNAYKRSREGWSVASRFLGTAQLGMSIALMAVVLATGFMACSVLAKHPEYRQPTSPSYVPSHLFVTLVSMFLSAVVAYPQLCCWSALADALFYCYLLEETCPDEQTRDEEDPMLKVHAPLALKELLLEEMEGTFRA